VVLYNSTKAKTQENQNKQKSIIPKKTQNKTKKSLNNNSKNPHEIPFVLAVYSCTRDLPWSVVDTPSDTPLGKMIFSFPAGIKCK